MRTCTANQRDNQDLTNVRPWKLEGVLSVMSQCCRAMLSVAAMYRGITTLAV